MTCWWVVGCLPEWTYEMKVSNVTLEIDKRCYRIMCKGCNARSLSTLTHTVVLLQLLSGW